MIDREIKKGEKLRLNRDLGIVDVEGIMEDYGERLFATSELYKCPLHFSVYFEEGDILISTEDGLISEVEFDNEDEIRYRGFDPEWLDELN